MNVHRQNKHVATDTIYSDTPVIYYGSTCVKLYIVTKSLVSDVYGMKTDNQFFNTLQGIIIAQGEMSKLISVRDQSKAINSSHIILWGLFIDDLEK